MKLKEIAEITDARYFRATNSKKLAEIYQEIGEMEKTKIEVQEFTRYDEFFIYFLGLGLLFFAIEIIFSNTIFRKIP